MKTFKNLLILSLVALALTACGKKNSALDEAYKRGFSGTLWGEKSLEAASWIRDQKGFKISIIRQSDPKTKKESAKLRKKFLKTLELRAVPKINDDYAISYEDMGQMYLMSFDQEDRFCAVTLSSLVPSPPLTKDHKIKGTLKIFEEKTIKPLKAQYGSPRKKKHSKDGVERRYWIWEGKTVSYVVEFLFASETKRTPAFWQSSQSILLSSPKYYITNK